MSPGIRATAVLASVFALGVIAGMAIETHWAPHSPYGVSATAEHEAAMAELRELLELDDQQVAEIEGVIAQHQRTVELHWEQLRPEVQSAMRNVHQEISELLTDEQRRRFHRWLTDRLDPDGLARH